MATSGWKKMVSGSAKRWKSGDASIKVFKSNRNKKERGCKGERVGIKVEKWPKR